MSVKRYHAGLHRRTDVFLTKHLSSDNIPYRLVISIIIPILVDEAFIVLLSLVNTAMVSSSGVSAVSAVSTVDTINNFLVNVFVAIATGGTVVVAQYMGSENREMAARAGAGAVAVVALSALAIALTIIAFHAPLIDALFGGADADVLSNAKLYLIGSCLSYPCFAIYEAVCGVLKGCAQTRASLVLSILNHVSYFLLNLVFIAGLRMGVVGLILSMNLSRFFGMVCALVCLVRFDTVLRISFKRLFAFDFSVQKKILFIGLPFAAEQMFFNGGKIITQMFIVGLGTMSIAANAISNSVMWVFEIGPTALSIAVVTVVGMCMGRGNVAGARKFIRSFLVMGSGAFLLTDALFLPFLPRIIALFTPPQQLVHTIIAMICVAVVCHPLLWPSSFIVPSALRAAGDAVFTSWVSMCSMWALRVTLGYVLSVVLGIGIIGVYFAMVSEWLIRTVIFQIRLHGRKWCAHRVID